MAVKEKCPGCGRDAVLVLTRAEPDFIFPTPDSDYALVCRACAHRIKTGELKIES